MGPHSCWLCCLSLISVNVASLQQRRRPRWQIVHCLAHYFFQLGLQIDNKTSVSMSVSQSVLAERRVAEINVIVVAALTASKDQETLGSAAKDSHDA